MANNDHPTAESSTPRHEDAYRHDPLTRRIIGCAIEVHRELGPGLIEATYEEALCIELASEGIPFVRQSGVPVYYKGHLIGEHRPDLVVQDRVVVEVKSVDGSSACIRHNCSRICDCSRSQSASCSTSTAKCCEPASGAS
jgi:GxxExxY protein